MELHHLSNRTSELILARVLTAKVGLFRRESLTRCFDLPASLIQRFTTCGKPNCACGQGKRHGPFFYLTANLAPGHILKFLLKTVAQQQAAARGFRAYQEHWERLEELFQVNAELLRRGEPLAP